MSTVPRHIRLLSESESEPDPQRAALDEDEALFNLIFRAYYVPLCTYAAGFAQSWDLAEEVVQTVFTNCWNAQEHRKFSGNIRAYLYSAVRNRTLNERRHERVIARTEEAFMLGTLPVQGPPGLSTVPMRPDASLERDESINNIYANIAELPERAREVLTLRWEHGMSYDEIAELLNVRASSVRQQHSRALAMLRKRLGPVFHVEDE